MAQLFIMKWTRRSVNSKIQNPVKSREIGGNKMPILDKTVLRTKVNIIP